MESTSCCGSDTDRSYFVPYKRVIRGSKQVILPLKDSKGDICGFDPLQVEQSPLIMTSITNSAIKAHTHTKSGECYRTEQTAYLPGETRWQSLYPKEHFFPSVTEPHLVPLSTPVRGALISADDRPFQHIVTPLQKLATPRQSSLQHELQTRIKDIETKTKQSSKPTPMSLFRNDNRILQKAYRNFRRDINLQKERGFYQEKPKRFPDEVTRQWYYDMVGGPQPRMEHALQEALNQTDCYQFRNDTGVSCFHCPHRDLDYSQIQGSATLHTEALRANEPGSRMCGCSKRS